MCGGKQFNDFILEDGGICDKIKEFHIGVFSRTVLRADFEIEMLGANLEWDQYHSYQNIVNWTASIIKSEGPIFLEKFEMIFPALFKLGFKVIKRSNERKDKQGKESVRKMLRELLYEPMEEWRTDTRGHTELKGV